MSISSGGRADKLGNRYEGLWVAFNLLRLLAEEILGLQLEGVGDDEHGVDFWLQLRNGSREAHQCKRKNRIVGKWGVGELDRQGVLKALADQLQRDLAAHFVFVSSHPAAELRELCDSARMAGDNADVYFEEMLKVKAHADNLRHFCKAVGIDAQAPTDRQRNFDLLRRTETHHFEDNRIEKARICSWARCHIVGNAETAIEVLANYAEERMGHLLTVDQVRQHLRERGFQLVNLAGDRKTSERVECLQREFQESLRPNLIHAAPIVRSETKSVLDLIVSQGENRLVIVHGRAGGGKSCVLLQLTEELGRAGIPFLPLRLDRRQPHTSSQRFGVDGCGLPESPAVTLRSLYGNRRTVLILDQLDAIRWTTHHASAPWEACRETIDEALAFPNMFIVVACRTFDLRDDQQIQTWQAQRKGTEIEVEELSEAAVAEVVRASGRSVESLTGRQKALLRSPLLLSLWTQLHVDGNDQSAWNTQTELMRLFWKSRFEAAAKRGVAPAECRAAVDCLVREIDRNGGRPAPARILDAYPQALDAFRSLNVIVEAQKELLFAHQSFFEYQLAVQLLGQAKEGKQTVTNWIKASDQSLLRRDQLRLVLTLLRDENPAEYIDIARNILAAPAPGIRFHLKQLLLQFIGMFPEPLQGERDLVGDLMRAPEWFDHLFEQVLFRQGAWFDILNKDGTLTNWLSATDEVLQNKALHLCLWWSGVRGDDVADLLTPYVDQPVPGAQRVVAALPFNPTQDSPRLFALRTRLMRLGMARHWFLNAKELAEKHPKRCIDLLEAFFYLRVVVSDERSRTRRPDGDIPYHVPFHEIEELKKVAAALAEDAWNRLVPLLVQVCEANRAEVAEGREPPRFFHDTVWPQNGRLHHHDGQIALSEILAVAGATLAATNPEFGSMYAAVLDHGALTVQRLIAETFAIAATGTVSDVAISWLCSMPERLALNDGARDKWTLAQRIIRQHAPVCSSGVYRQLEETILHFHDADEVQSFRWKVKCTFAGYPLEANRYGLGQHALLPCLPGSRMSAAARSLMGVLGRKFQQPADEFYEDRTCRIRSLVAPIRNDRVGRISDKGWLQIIGGAARQTGLRLHRDVGDRFFTEPNAAAYARLLGDQARRNPHRFANLALRIPLDADPEYLSAILYALGDLNPPTTDLLDWTAATDAQLTAIIERIGYRPDGEIGRSLCWPMDRRLSACATPLCREILCRYATDHPNPPPDDGNWKGDYDNEAINCTRGMALHAIAHQLFDDKDLFDVFIEAIRRAVDDPSAIVRVAATRACLPLLNKNRDVGVDMFLRACESQDQILASHSVIEFIQYAQSSHYSRLEPLLIRMAHSSYPSVAAAGAAWITVNSLYNGVSAILVDEYSAGNAAQRKGVATAAAHNCEDPKVASRCAELLLRLIADADAEVQDAAAEFIHRKNVLSLTPLRTVAVQFVNGLLLERHSTWLIQTMRDCSESLVDVAPIIFALCDRLTSDPAVIAQGSVDHFAMDLFFPLLLRLYEQAEQDRNHALRGKCLDRWDRLLEMRIGGARDLLVKLEQGGEIKQ